MRLSLNSAAGFVTNPKRNNEFYEYDPVDGDAFMDSVYGNLTDLDKERFLAGEKYRPGNFVSSDFLGSLDLDSDDFDKEEALEELAENFTAKEQIKAAYAMATWDATEKLRIIGGVRLEHTRNEYDAFFYDDDADTLTPVSGAPKEYYNVLPYIHLLYKLDDRTNIRFAYTHSLARPDYFDLALTANLTMMRSISAIPRLSRRSRKYRCYNRKVPRQCRRAFGRSVLQGYFRFHRYQKNDR